MNVGAACASGALGVILARQWLASGFATDVIVSGTDLSVTAENAWGMGSLGVLATEGPPEQACRPFQEGSQGFLAGEASAALVVTGQRDVEMYAHVLGGGFTHDAFHPIAIQPDGLQVAAAWSQAMADAGVEPADIAYINAHGSGTVLNDTVEAGVADALFPATHQDVLDQDAHRARSGRGRSPGDSHRRAHLRAWRDPRSSAGRRGQSPRARRRHAAGARPDAEIVDRHGRLQRRARHRSTRELIRHCTDRRPARSSGHAARARAERRTVLDWTDEHKMLRDAIRTFVEKEIVPLHGELEHGDLAPYGVLRKLFAAFGIDELARDGFKKRLERDTATPDDLAGGSAGIAGRQGSTRR